MTPPPKAEGSLPREQATPFASSASNGHGGENKSVDILKRFFDVFLIYIATPRGVDTVDVIM
jgi:hypothetical protein